MFYKHSHLVSIHTLCTTIHTLIQDVLQHQTAPHTTATSTAMGNIPWHSHINTLEQLRFYTPPLIHPYGMICLFYEILISTLLQICLQYIHIGIGVCVLPRLVNFVLLQLLQPHIFPTSFPGIPSTLPCSLDAYL